MNILAKRDDLSTGLSRLIRERVNYAMIVDRVWLRALAAGDLESEKRRRSGRCQMHVLMELVRIHSRQF